VDIHTLDERCSGTHQQVQGDRDRDWSTTEPVLLLLLSAPASGRRGLRESGDQESRTVDVCGSWGSSRSGSCYVNGGSQKEGGAVERPGRRMDVQCSRSCDPHRAHRAPRPSGRRRHRRYRKLQVRQHTQEKTRARDTLIHAVRLQLIRVSLFCDLNLRWYHPQPSSRTAEFKRRPDKVVSFERQARQLLHPQQFDCELNAHSTSWSQALALFTSTDKETLPHDAQRTVTQHHFVQPVQMDPGSQIQIRLE